MASPILLTAEHGERRPAIPRLIRRNTLLLAATQAFVGMGSQMVPTLGGLMIERLLGSVALAGIATSMIYVARVLVAYPVGWVMDTYGRKAGLMLGLVLSLFGAVGVGLSVVWTSFPLFLAGLLVFGLGVGAGQQLRTAAADMYLPDRRAEGLGYVLTGSLVGALGGPALIQLAQAGAPLVHLDASALAWLLVPAVLIPSMGLVFLIRPDPKEIAANLARFYPGYVPAAAAAGTDARLADGASLRTWLAHYPLMVGFLATFVVHGIMAMMMALTPLVMAHHNAGLAAISLAVSMHVVGMYGLSLPLGRLTDRIGRRMVIVAGLIVSAVGSLLVPITPDYAVSAVGLILVGVGWSCVNVAVTALVADTVPAAERGRAVGIVDSFGGVASIVLPLAGGVLADAVGFPALALVATALVLPALALALRLAEPHPGRHARALPV